MGIYYAIITSLLQGVGYSLLKKSFDELPSSISFMIETIFGLVLWIGYSLITGIEVDKLPIVFLYAFISAVLSEAFVFYALSKGDMNITRTIFSTYPIFTMLLSYIFLREELSLAVILFILVTIMGILVLALPEKFSKNELKKKVYILWPLAAAIAVGISDTLSKNVLSEVNSSIFLFCLAICQIPVSIGYIYLERSSSELKNVMNNIKTYRATILSSLTISASMIFFWLAYENTFASIASPITATNTLFVLIISMIFMRYRPGKIEVGGILVTIAGIIGVGVLS